MSDSMEIRMNDVVQLNLGNTIPVPVRDYLLMVNKPMINGQELVGNLIIKVGDLDNDAGYLVEETDPTVADWAKQPNKPTYTPEEIGAMPSTVVIPVRISQLENDTGYYVFPITGIPKSDLEPGIIPEKVSELTNDVGFYIRPNGGIPAADLETAIIRSIQSKLDAALKGSPGGLAELDQNGMVPSHQLPSYVDDVKSYASQSLFPAIGEDDKIYVDKSTNKTYRWAGVDVGYITIGTSLALGETANTAYRGDRGKAAYDHAMAKGEAYTSGLYKITTNAEGHVIAATPVVKDDITALGIPGSMPDTSQFYVKPQGGIPSSDLSEAVVESLNHADSAYQIPMDGIPVTDLSDAVVESLNNADSAYQMPMDGIPATDLSDAVVESLNHADSAYQMPQGGIPATDLAPGVIPASAVEDVRVNNSSVLSNGIANIPKAGNGVFGVVKLSSTYGIMDINGTLRTLVADDSTIKSGSNGYHVICPSVQHQAAFYGLAKAAGDTTQKSSNVFGVYTDAALEAIQKMLGFDGILGDYESSDTASKAYAVGDVFIFGGKRYKVTSAISKDGLISPGTNCEPDPLDGRYVRDTDYATGNDPGIMKVTNYYGIDLVPSGNDAGFARINKATSDQIKAGANNYRPIVPSIQHESLFYGLSKLAGVDLASVQDVVVGTYPAEAKAAILAMLGAVDSADAADENHIGLLRVASNGDIKAGSSKRAITALKQYRAVFYGLAEAAGANMSASNNEVGVYTTEAKTAIQTMLGIEADIPLIEEVSGASPSITGMPNVRYICGTVSTLTITPPASGSIVVRFTSGSTATLLTVPNTVKFPVWFDPTSLEADTTYEIIITDGVYGGVMSWA